MKGTKEELSKSLNFIADGIKEIAEDIMNDKYDPRKWQELSSTMSLVTMCLQNEPFNFMSKTYNEQSSAEYKK